MENKQNEQTDMMPEENITQSGVAEMVTSEGATLTLNDLVDEDGEATQTVYEEEEETECGPLRGWLLLFLIVGVGLGSIVSFISTITEFESGPLAEFYLMDVMTSAVYLTIGIFTIIAFVKRWPDAVFLGKLFIVTNLVSNLGLALILPSSEVDAAMVIKPVIWSVVWFSFLCSSSQVEERIPTEIRKIMVRDWVLLGITVVTFLTSYITVESLLSVL